MPLKYSLSWFSFLNNFSTTKRRYFNKALEGTYFKEIMGRYMPLKYSLSWFSFLNNFSITKQWYFNKAVGGIYFKEITGSYMPLKYSPSWFSFLSNFSITKQWYFNKAVDGTYFKEITFKNNSVYKMAAIASDAKHCSTKRLPLSGDHSQLMWCWTVSFSSRWRSWQSSLPAAASSSLLPRSRLPVVWPWPVPGSHSRRTS